MSEETQSNVGTEVDPLSAAAEGWEGRKFPVIAADRLVKFKLTSAKKGTTKKGKPMLELVFSTEEDTTSRDGETLRAGWKVRKNINLEATPAKDGKRGYSMDNIKDDLLELLTWCGNKTTTARQLVDNPSVIEGYVGQAKTGIRDDEEFGASNTLRLVLPA